METERRLVAIMKAYMADPSIMEPGEQLAAEVSDEMHQLAHECLILMSGTPMPCELLTEFLLGIMKVGFAQALFTARPPEEERGASGPVMSDEAFRELLGDVNI